MHQKELAEILVSKMNDLVVHLESSLAPSVKRRLSSEDIAQETFLRAAESLHRHSYRGEKQFFGWLKRIAKHVVISHIRKHKHAAGHDSKTMSLVATLMDSNAVSGSDLVSKDENRTILAICFALLPDHHQRVLMMRYEDEAPFSEIGRKLNRTEGQVRGLHRNALNTLRREMDRLALHRSSFSG